MEVLMFQVIILQRLIKLPTSLQITKDGAVFGGWYQNSGFTTNCYSFANAGAYDTNVTYYAKWLDGVSENGQQAYNQIQSASANANVVITGELSEADLLYMGTALKKKSESVKLDLSGATLTVLPQDVFSDSKITSLTLPSSITDIKSGALKDCPNLTTLIYSGTQDQWKDIHFGRQTSNIWRDNIGTTQVTCSDGSMDFPFFEMKTQAYAAASDPNVSGSNLTNLISGTGTQDDPWVLPENLYAIQVGYRSDSSCGFYTMDLGYFSYGSGPAGSWKLWLDSSKSYEEKVIRCRVSGDFNMIFYIKVSAR